MNKGSVELAFTYSLLLQNAKFSLVLSFVQHFFARSNALYFVTKLFLLSSNWAYSAETTIADARYSLLQYLQKLLRAYQRFEQVLVFLKSLSGLRPGMWKRLFFNRFPFHTYRFRYH